MDGKSKERKREEAEANIVGLRPVEFYGKSLRMHHATLDTGKEQLLHWERVAPFASTFLEDS